MASFVVKNGHQNDMCYNEIELCAQYMDIILGLFVNILIIILKLEMILILFDLLVPWLWMGGDPNGQNCLWSWKCSQ